MSNIERHPVFCQECGVQEQDEIDIRVRDRVFGDPLMCDECYDKELILQKADLDHQQDKDDRLVFMEDYEPWEKGD